MNRILFVSVHPDDETLGCGGAMLKCKKVGHQVFWLNLTSGTLDHPFGFTENTINKRNKTIKAVADAFSFDEYKNLEYPTQMLESIEPRLLINGIKDAYNAYKPDTVFIPNRSDIHSDHRVAFDALFSAAKNFRSSYIKEILMYETLSETEFAPALVEKAFIPNTFIDISEFMEDKIRIMQIYDTELMPDPLPRSIHAIKGLAAFRGSRIGVKYAESFQLLYRVL
jgi:LmbE family N-acetylglucosaminyl deacetylase